MCQIEIVTIFTSFILLIYNSSERAQLDIFSESQNSTHIAIIIFCRVIVEYFSGYSLLAATCNEVVFCDN